MPLRTKARIVVGAVALTMILSGCVQVQAPDIPTMAVLPPGPSVTAAPAPNKSFEAFQQDKGACMQDANRAVAGGVEAANREAIGTAALGTLLGAGVGAAIGGASGSPGIGAAIGAALAGGIAAYSASQSQDELQQQYDRIYADCMSAKGDRVPGSTPPVVSPSPPPLQDYPSVSAVTDRRGSRQLAAASLHRNETAGIAFNLDSTM